MSCLFGEANFVGICMTVGISNVFNLLCKNIVSSLTGGEVQLVGGQSVSIGHVRNLMKLLTGSVRLPSRVI